MQTWRWVRKMPEIADAGHGWGVFPGTKRRLASGRRAQLISKHAKAYQPVRS